MALGIVGLFYFLTLRYGVEQYRTKAQQMSTEDELMTIDQDLEMLANKVTVSTTVHNGQKFQKQTISSSGLATLKRLRTEAKELIDGALGFSSNFSLSFLSLPSDSMALDQIEQCRGIIQGAVNHLHRRPEIKTQSNVATKTPFVDMSRLDELRTVRSDLLDLTRLIQLCVELNIACSNYCYMTMAMLGRAILDHVPPVFGNKNFSEVTKNSSIATSNRNSLIHLDKSLRYIADAHLHVQIRRKEVLPTEQQVDFRRDLDVLLGEIVRVLK